MKKLNEYEVKVDIKFSQLVSAESKAKAIQQVKYSFDDEYNLQLTDDEIVEVIKLKNE